MLFDYDDGDVESIEIYAKKLVGRTFRDVKEDFDKSPIKRYHNPKDPIDFSIEEDEVEYASNGKAKGELGNFLEKYYFGYISPCFRCPSVFHPLPEQSADI